MWKWTKFVFSVVGKQGGNIYSLCWKLNQEYYYTEKNELMGQDAEMNFSVMESVGQTIQ